MNRFRVIETLVLGVAFCVTIAGYCSAQIFTILASFNGANGAHPDFGGLAEGADGTFYGTTVAGGTKDLGTVFVVTESEHLTTLYNFCLQPKCADGATPDATLLKSKDGNFYGTTEGGGTHGFGEVFKITPAGELAVIYSFCSVSPYCLDGEAANALVLGADGNFYGTTAGGGGPNLGGTVFRLTPDGKLTTLYAFCVTVPCLDGAVPEAGLVQARNGSFYGTTFTGGAYNGGTIFEITPRGNFKSLYSFCSAGTFCGDGRGPGGLVQTGSGALFGTTQLGGTANFGTLFKVGMDTVTTLHTFGVEAGDGQNPTGLIQGANGDFYGTTGAGGTNATCVHNTTCGTVFEATQAGVLNVLYSFCSEPNCADGFYPDAGVVQGKDGNLYGVTANGANSSCFHGCGTVFRLDLKTGRLSSNANQTLIHARR